MDKELEFVDQYRGFYTDAGREMLLGKNALRIWKFPGREFRAARGVVAQ